MERFSNWLRITLFTLIGLTFVSQLSIERMSESPGAALEEFQRALLSSVQFCELLLPAVEAMLPTAILLGVVLFAVVRALIDWKRRL